MEKVEIRKFYVYWTAPLSSSKQSPIAKTANYKLHYYKNNCIITKKISEYEKN